MTQQELDAMSEALRSQGLTWSQTSFAISLVRNGVAAERERCAGLCESTYPEWNTDDSAFQKPCFDTPAECAVAIRSNAG